MNQCDMVLKYLREGRLVTSLVAFRSMGIVSLPKRICELKLKGHDIRSHLLRLPSGKRCKSYYFTSTGDDHG
jgi:hypothetical protein